MIMSPDHLLSLSKVDFLSRHGAFPQKFTKCEAVNLWLGTGKLVHNFARCANVNRIRLNRAAFELATRRTRRDLRSCSLNLDVH
jgi:hypothetical protein